MFPQSRATAEGLNLFLQPFDHPLILAKSLLELKMPIKVPDASDENPQENGAQDDQKKWNFGHFPLITPEGVKSKAKNDLVLVLNTEKDDHNKNHHPKKCFYPFHFVGTPFLQLFRSNPPVNTE